MWKAALRASRSPLPSSAGTACLARSPSLSLPTSTVCRAARRTLGLQRKGADDGTTAAMPVSVRRAASGDHSAALLRPRLYAAPFCSSSAASSVAGPAAAAASRPNGPGNSLLARRAAYAPSESMPAVHTASLKELLLKLKAHAAIVEASSASAAIGSHRLAEAIQTLSTFLNSPDAITVDGAAGALCNVLLLTSGRSSGSSSRVGGAGNGSDSGGGGIVGSLADLEVATSAAIDLQPILVPLCAARKLEESNEADKSGVRKLLVTRLKAKLTDTVDAADVVDALHSCNLIDAAVAEAAAPVADRRQGRQQQQQQHHVGGADLYAELRDVAERGVLRLAASMDGHKLCQVLYLLAVSGAASGGGSAARSHSVQLMRTVASQAANRRFVMSGQRLSNTLYACSMLGLYDRRLLARLDEMARFAAQRDRLYPETLASVILSVGKLRWHSPKLLDALCSRFAYKGVTSFRPEAIASLLHTCAQVAYAPGSLPLVAHQAVEHLASNVDLLLDATWSLLAVGVHSSAHLAAVLDDEFLKGLGKLNVAKHKKVYNDLKLVNIAFAAANGNRRELESLHQKLTSHKVDIQSIKALPREKSAAVLSDDVSAVLSYIAPKGTHQNVRVMTVAGHDIDVELLVDSEGQPKPLKDYARPYATATTSGAAGSIGAQIPAGWHWVALKVLGYYDVLLSPEPDELSGSSLPTEEGDGVDGNRCKPIGRHQLAERQLTSMGYTVVTVDYKEYLPTAEPPKKLNLLKSRIAASLH